MRPLPDSSHASLGASPCPDCGESLPVTLMDGDIGLPGRSKKQYAICPNCSTRLVREPEADNANLRSWHQRPEPFAPPGMSTM